VRQVAWDDARTGDDKQTHSENTKYRSKVPTNLLEALKGTNSQVLVDAMYQSYAESGQKLHNAKNK
jgi:hypothetical protein